MAEFVVGETVLLNFPFSNLADSKKRLALVLAAFKDGDLLLARITTRDRAEQHEARITAWQEAGPLYPSVVRLHKIATLSSSLIEKKLGRLSINDWSSVAVLWPTLIRQ